MLNQSQASKISFDDTMDIDRSHARCHALEPDSSDEDEARERYRLYPNSRKIVKIYLASKYLLSRVEIIPSVMLDGESSAPGSASGTRRKVFAKSKSVKTCYSMPAPVRFNFYQKSKLVSRKLIH